MQALDSLYLKLKLLQHGLSTAQQVRLQNDGHALTEKRASRHLAPQVPEKEMSDSFALLVAEKQ